MYLALREEVVLGVYSRLHVASIKLHTRDIVWVFTFYLSSLWSLYKRYMTFRSMGELR